MTAHDLKPCPFCGGEARIETVNHDYGVTYSVGCFGSGRCGASFTLFDHRNDAIAAWNRRTPADEDPHTVMHVYEGDGGVIIRENGNISSFGVQSAEVQAAFAAATTTPVAEAVAAEQVDYPRILYVCEHCQENAPEMCGRARDDLYVTPSGQWLCDECIDEEGVPISDCVPPPALYPASTVARLQQEIQRLTERELRSPLPGPKPLYAKEARS